MGYHISRDLDDAPPAPALVRAKVGDTKRIMVARKSQERVTYTARVIKVTPYFVVCVMSPGGYTECFLHSDWNNGAAMG